MILSSYKQSVHAARIGILLMHSDAYHIKRAMNTYPPPGRVLRNTFIFEVGKGRGHRTIVRFHEVDVASFNGNTVRLDSGGYRTPSTQHRINNALATAGWPVRVHRINREWMVQNMRSGNLLDFSDGMVLHRPPNPELTAETV